MLRSIYLSLDVRISVSGTELMAMNKQVCNKPSE